MSVSNRALRTAAGLAGLALLATGVATSAASADTSSSSRPVARATLQDADGQTVGSVHLIERRGAVAVSADVRGLEPGFHGFHVHETGVCEPPFTSAAGHFNPGGTTHADHAGDMVPLLVMENGRASLALETDRFAVSDLLDEDGSAIVVHAAPDNFANIDERYLSLTEDALGPDSETLATGDAGARVACGVVR